MKEKIKMNKIGATGEFPNGKLNDADEGELAIGVAIDKEKGVVLLEFGKPVNWLGLYPAQAREIAAILIAKAGELESINRKF